MGYGPSEPIRRKSGPRSVIQAVVAARRAAASIHSQIMDVPKEPADSRFNFTRGKSFDNVDLRNFEGINVKLREKMPERRRGSSWPVLGTTTFATMSQVRLPLTVSSS